MLNPRLYKPRRIANFENQIQIVDTLKSLKTRASTGSAAIASHLNRTLLAANMY
jgi:hypothetical protein